MTDDAPAPGDHAPPRVGVVVVDGDRPGQARDRIEARIRDLGHRVAARTTVRGSRDEVTRALLELTDAGDCDVVLTVGGVGLGAGDVVPEATRTILHRRVPGLAERVRGRGGDDGGAALERGVAGVRGRTMVVNLPGATSDALAGLEAVEPLLASAAAELRGSEGAAEDGTAGG